MRLRLQATEEELYEKGERLIEALAESLFHASPTLSDRLEKALPERETVLKFPALQGLKEAATEEYRAMLQRMLADIYRILDSADSAAPTLQKSTKPQRTPVCSVCGSRMKQFETGKGEWYCSENSDHTAHVQKAEGFYDYSQDIAEVEERMYRRVKLLAIRRGYAESDFAEGGALYGWSTNEILELLRDRGE